LTKIGLISDTHSYLHPAVFEHFSDVDEIWHAGDFGQHVATALQNFKPLRAVYGNIDDATIRHEFPEDLIFTCEKVKVLIRHIGGYPPKYNTATKALLQLHAPQLFITGHSHILKIQYDSALQCLHINPGAAGQQGWHKVKTLVKFTINEADIKDAVVIELP
jgi:uncharacterized protein